MAANFCCNASDDFITRIRQYNFWAHSNAMQYVWCSVVRCYWSGFNTLESCKSETLFPRSWDPGGSSWRSPCLKLWKSPRSLAGLIRSVKWYGENLLQQTKNVKFVHRTNRARIHRQCQKRKFPICYSWLLKDSFEAKRPKYLHFLVKIKCI